MDDPVEVVSSPPFEQSCESVDPVHAKGNSSETASSPLGNRALMSSSGAPYSLARINTHSTVLDRISDVHLIGGPSQMKMRGWLKGIYTPAGSLTFSNSGLPDHHSPTL